MTKEDKEEIKIKWKMERKTVEKKDDKNKRKKPERKKN